MNDNVNSSHLNITILRGHRSVLAHDLETLIVKEFQHTVKMVHYETMTDDDICKADVIFIIVEKMNHPKTIALLQKIKADLKGLHRFTVAVVPTDPEFGTDWTIGREAMGMGIHWFMGQYYNQRSLLLEVKKAFEHRSYRLQHKQD